MISGARSYISARILEIDSDFEEWEDGFNKDNIPSSLMDKSFFIEYALETPTQENTFIIDTTSATLTLFFKGFRNIKEALDSSMDLADTIRINVLSKAKIATGNYLNIINLSLVPSPIDESNDNSIAIEMTFNLTETKAIC